LGFVPLADLAHEHLGQHRAGTRRSPLLMPGRLNTGTVPPMMAGNCTMPSLSRSAPLTGASLAPKATVLARIWRRPPDEPIDW